MNYVEEYKKPIFKGKLKLPLLTCKECGYIIARGVSRESVKDLISYCPKCGSFLSE